MIKRRVKRLDVVLERALNGKCPLTGKDIIQGTSVVWIDYWSDGIAYPVRVAAKYIH